MAQSSLITTTETVKKYLIYFGIFILVVILLQFCLNSVQRGGGLPGGGSGEDGIKPFKEATAEVAELGTPPDLPSVAISSKSDLLFNVDNNFQELQFDAVNVYKIEQPRERFATETKAEDIAERFGFESRPQRQGADRSILKWQDGTRELTYDKVKQELNFNNFSIYPNRGEVFTRDEASLGQDGARLIENLGLNRPNLDLGNIKINYLTRVGSRFEETSPGTATFVMIRAYRSLEGASLKTDADGEPLSALERDYEPLNFDVVYEDYLSAPLEIIIAASDRMEADDIYSVRYIDWNIEPDPQTYKIITPAEAWENVKAGKGSLQLLNEFGFDPFQTGKRPGKEVLSFTANYLETEVAYLETNEWHGYFYPIYIFRGRAKLSNSPNQDNADFVFYAYAIQP